MPTPRRPRRDPYEVIARVYDQDVHLEVPRAFFRALRPLFRDVRTGPPVLDLGCGSGLLTERIARAGARVIGVDGSPAMLARARARCAPLGARVRLARRRLDALRLPPRAELAVACGDVMNHLPSEAVLRRVLASIRGSLAGGGLLVFDALTRHGFEEYWPDNTHVLQGPCGDLLMECDWDPEERRGSVHVIAWARDGRGRYTRAEATLFEYLHGDREIARSLRRAGFSEVWRRPWTPWADARHEPRLDRALWCGRVRGGEPRLRASRLRELGFRRLARAEGGVARGPAAPRGGSPPGGVTRRGPGPTLPSGGGGRRGR
jgi:SAM-dependent methyltransferase